MSIFKETFRKYVEKQFEVRQKLIARGNSDKDSTSRLTSGPDGLEPGAFYAYGQKQCVIRLASLVDLMEDIGLNLNNEDFKTYKGETFARNFILEGGISSVYSRNINRKQETRVIKEPRGGFPSSKKDYNLSYGDPSISSNPDSDGYGAVPMPGITDANIRTKSAYGSLREAKVNFVCHNLRQLEILELLYMRPGYPVLMEWGWSPYIKNDGSIENSFPMISDEDYFWDDRKINQIDLQIKIIDKKRNSDGNYDGFVGFVTNFNYSARPDGGFNCSTELISMGEVLDSLKVPSFSFSNIDQSLFSTLSEKEKEKVIYNSSLGILIQDINSVVNVADTKAAAARLQSAAKQQEDGTNIDWANNYATTILANVAFTKKQLSQTLGDSFSEEVFIEKGQIISGLNNGGEILTKTGFIRWDALAHLLNEEVIITNEKGHKPIRIETNLIRNQNSKDLELNPILYAKYSNLKDEIMDVSCSSKVCILPHQFQSFDNDDPRFTFRQRVGNILLSFSRYTPNRWKTFKEAFTAEKSLNSPNLSEIEVKNIISERRIGGIYIGVDFLTETFLNVFKNNKDATLGNFLKELWDKINEQCPMHNFGLRVDHEFTNIVQVIDLPISTSDIEDINYNKLFSFNVQSNDTIVREFKYDTQIPNALKATIAINAQSGATADDLDSVTFAAFNRSIKSRLHSLNKKFSEREEEKYEKLQKTRQEKEIRLIELETKIKEYSRIFFDTIDATENDSYDSKFSNIKTQIQEAQSLELYLEKSTSGYLKNQAIIPINLNLVLDGISGIIIGNVFRVDESRLPKAYKKSKIAFVALGEEQNITAGQDWTTNIRGQIILFPTSKEIKDLGKDRISDRSKAEAEKARLEAEAQRKAAELKAAQEAEARAALFTGDLVETANASYVKGSQYIKIEIEIYRNSLNMFFIREVGGNSRKVIFGNYGAGELRTDIVYKSAEEIKNLLLRGAANNSDID